MAEPRSTSQSVFHAFLVKAAQSGPLTRPDNVRVLDDDGQTSSARRSIDNIVRGGHHKAMINGILMLGLHGDIELVRRQELAWRR